MQNVLNKTRLSTHLSSLLSAHSLKFSTVIISLTLISGCSSLGGGSVEKRAVKLSSGIQKAYSVNPETANRVSPYIVQTADQYNLDPLLLAAVIRQESTFRPYVSSPAGAVGLTQVMPRYWQATCPGDLYDELTNINCGSFILTKYKNAAGSMPKALAYYNVGPTAYNTNRKMKKQGKRYAKQVKQHRNNLKSAL
ncbi:transglycosylase SLT domain-containing protein [Acinetobacter sp. ANC 5579]|uniref:lytic transglycosylase domain-containing protein n=1 Tax=Acinetobacter TaxID=469 RepID=UPI0015D229E5|nr:MULTISPECIES: transglycosylase SLT domain-containing protein [Acinetobacter]MCL6230905.1 transglycosylase SLT domain-containing protein [Acinetobacter amyesii]MCL6234821.1 transglycosylase SLT domain-containing protein [Acinetobacter amyesii]